MAAAGTFHCANPAYSTLGVWELWRFLSWWIDHVAKGAVFIIIASLPSDHADVFDTRLGATQQLDANRLGRCHLALFIHAPINQASERRLHGGFKGKRRITSALIGSQNI